MSRRYDLHIHSCLSPCGDGDMTPNNIVNMAALAGLDIIAITDHNSCGNCLAAIEVAKNNYPEMLVVAGMELETSEEVHVVCLFADPLRALDFEREITAGMNKIPNAPSIYGEQLLMDCNDNQIGSVEHLLVTATSVNFDDVPALARRFGGVAFCAHVDRDSYSAISNLGFISPDSGYGTIEISRKLFAQNRAQFIEKYGLMSYNVLMDSDAHYLEDIGTADGVTNSNPKSAAELIELIATVGI